MVTFENFVAVTERTFQDMADAIKECSENGKYHYRHFSDHHMVSEFTVEVANGDKFIRIESSTEKENE